MPHATRHATMLVSQHPGHASLWLCATNSTGCSHHGSPGSTRQYQACLQSSRPAVAHPAAAHLRKGGAACCLSTSQDQTGGLRALLLLVLSQQHMCSTCCATCRTSSLWLQATELCESFIGVAVLGGLAAALSTHWACTFPYAADNATCSIPGFSRGWGNRQRLVLSQTV